MHELGKLRFVFGGGLNSTFKHHWVVVAVFLPVPVPFHGVHGCSCFVLETCFAGFQGVVGRGLHGVGASRPASCCGQHLT